MNPQSILHGAPSTQFFWNSMKPLSFCGCGASDTFVLSIPPPPKKFPGFLEIIFIDQFLNTWFLIDHKTYPWINYKIFWLECLWPRLTVCNMINITYIGVSLLYEHPHIHRSNHICVNIPEKVGVVSWLVKKQMNFF